MTDVNSVIRNTLKTLAFGGLFVLSATTVLAQTADPLAKFRTNNNDNQAQQVPSRPSTPVNNQVPAPTIGGTQQGGLQQSAIDQALQSYNLDGGMSLEERQAEAERMAREAAFEATMNGAFPLKPEEIMEILDRYREIREASESRIGGAPKPEITMQSVSLDPGSKPPTIQLSPGYVTTLNIVDMTGQPWPIQDLSWGGTLKSFNQKKAKTLSESVQ